MVAVGSRVNVAAGAGVGGKEVQAKAIGNRVKKRELYRILALGMPYLTIGFIPWVNVGCLKPEYCSPVRPVRGQGAGHHLTAPLHSTALRIPDFR